MSVDLTAEPPVRTDEPSEQTGELFAGTAEPSIKTGEPSPRTGEPLTGTAEPSAHKKVVSCTGTQPDADLLRAAQNGDGEAFDQVVRENSGLIWSIVRRYAGRGVEQDDLYQLGCLGFLKAVKGFDFTYGTCFSTYAVPKIAGEIRRYLRDNGPLKIGRTMREAVLTLYRLRERLRHELGREPALSELSAEAGLPPEEIARLELSGEAPESLQQETADGLPLEGLLGTEAPEDSIVERLALREAVDALPEKERLAILCRYFRGLTQDQTARILRVSQVQVSRLERRGLDRLRRTFGEV